MNDTERREVDEQVVNQTHSFDISDAIRLGSIEKAILYKEIYRMSLYKIRNGYGPWVFYSRRALAQKFPYMSHQSVSRWLLELEKEGEVISTVNNKHKYDHTKSYCPSKLEYYTKTEHRMAQNEPGLAQNEPTIPPLSTPQSNISASRKENDSVEDSDAGEIYFEEEGAKPARRPKVQRKRVDQHILDGFSLWGKYPQVWEANVNQRESMQRLLDEHGGIEGVKGGIAFWQRNLNDKHCPSGSSPWALDNNWAKFVEFRERNKL